MKPHARAAVMKEALMTTISSAVDLWRNLCSGAGLELRLKGGKPGRDVDVEESLRAVLGAPALAPSLEAWLMLDATAAQPTVTTERLLVEVLNSQGGFARMMRDILDVLVCAQAQQSSRPLSVSFKFDEVSDPIKETLEQFRDATSRVHRVLTSRPELPNSNAMWSVFGALDDFAPRHRRDWPKAFPSVTVIPSTGHDSLDTQLARLAGLVSDFIELWMRHGSTREEVRTSAAGIDRSRADARVLTGQLYAATDYWDHQVLAAAHAVSQGVVATQIDPEDVLGRLANNLGNIEWKDVWVEHTVQELLDLLNLPAWKRRHELYSVWIGTRMLRVVENVAADMHFHPVDGVLSFEFGGSRLASYSWNGEQFDVWAELRSALVGRSVKRKKGIQPDFRVVRAGLAKSTSVQTTYVLECKHYLNASTSNFTQAAADYARSCPNATVHVVNHGPANAVALNAALPAELQPRARFICDATPSREVSSRVLDEAIQKALFPDLHATAIDASIQDPLTSAALLRMAKDCVGYVTLEWDESLKDMDLALKVIAPDGTATESIDLWHQGDLEDAPFASFNEDVLEGPGTERIDIKAWIFKRYELVATNYSRAGRMSPDSLYCRIVTATGMTQIFCPESLPETCDKWRIAELLVSGGMVTIVPIV